MLQHHLPSTREEVPVTFGDVSVHFSREQRKELYREVMKYNYGILVSLGEPRVGAAPEGEQHPHLEAGPGRKEFSSRADWQRHWRFFTFLCSMGHGSLAGGFSAA
uniref:KRAB domain-containing protein n=1 Tax=Gopherus evgoodei TaxID=1825980 RepID=A0A8C4VP22_9SAUR